jgi:hypothetical protein
VAKSEPIAPETVEGYLEGKFGDALPEARKAMQELASGFDPEVLALCGFSLYGEFRPKIPEQG